MDAAANLSGSGAPVQAPDDWIVRLIATITTERPDEIARVILNRALQYSGERTSDDMTVLVARVYRKRSRTGNRKESSSGCVSSQPKGLSLSM